MKVTPEMAAPIIAKATTNHGIRRLPVKNDELSDPRDAKYDTHISSKKYAAIVKITITGCDIILTLYSLYNK
jgi:hypothetical protein